MVFYLRQDYVILFDSQEELSTLHMLQSIDKALEATCTPLGGFTFGSMPFFERLIYFGRLLVSFSSVDFLRNEEICHSHDSKSAFHRVIPLL